MNRLKHCSGLKINIIILLQDQTTIEIMQISHDWMVKGPQCTKHMYVCIIDHSAPKNKLHMYTKINTNDNETYL